MLSLVTSINLSGGLHIADDIDDDEGLQVNGEDISIAIPATRDAPYDNKWRPIEDDTTLEDIGLDDYTLLAFKFVDDADFHIMQLEYNEQAE